MEYRIKGLQPEALFRFFEDISAIPRGSHNEKAISDYLVSFAKERGLWVNQDAANNVIIKKPASAGAENAAPVMLQGHLDMVCEKLAGVEHDFETEGLDLIVEDGVLRANGTTLGGDNGAAVALMMTVLDDDTLRHPPLECVFTVCEEVGLDGAKALDKSQLDSRTMINLDSEEEGVATVSCAGGMRYALVRPAQREEAHGFPVSLEIRGLLGGHSGSDIHKERRNGVKLMARVLRHLTAGKDCRLMAFDGGSKDNAIPRECSASVLYLNREEAQKALEAAQELGKALAEEILPTEPSFVFTAAAGEEQDCQVLTPQAGQALVNAACLAPNGVRVRNPKQGNFVVTSLNLGVVRSAGERLELVFAPRSSVESLQEETEEALALLAETFGFTTEITGRYPGWAYAEHSPIRDVFCESYKTLFGGELSIEAIHAGLECGLFSEALPGLDAIAVGPTIRGCHTPDEHLPLDSFTRFYQLLTDVLARLAEK
ncbi:aminoacyl-histidine dipeptidase [Dysosmobacter sp.]|uniref:aminoacyl-histidine dipeptidase n=1 Tax=Dysosmobacter sp. TaxID=2591382 RepID=UPI003FD87F1D